MIEDIDVLDLAEEVAQEIAWDTEWLDSGFDENLETLLALVALEGEAVR